MLPTACVPHRKVTGLCQTALVSVPVAILCNMHLEETTASLELPITA